MNVDDVIEQYIIPNLDKECERLGIPRDFINSIKGIYPRQFEYSSLCEPIYEESRVTKVDIRLDVTEKSKLKTLMNFWHELYHAGEYHTGNTHAHIKSNLYEWRRAAGYVLGSLRDNLLPPFLRHNP